MENKTLYTIIVHSENIAGILNQITAVFTRRQLNIESLNVSASSIRGVHKYTITCWATPDIVEKVAKQIEKKMDVIQAHYFKDDEIFKREIALYIVEVNPVFSIVEMTGMSEDISSLYQELSSLNCVLQFVRSGRIAVSTSCFERVNEYLAHREERYQKEK